MAGIVLNISIKLKSILYNTNVNDDELITYNGKQYKFRELPSEVQNVLRDDNNNGIPDRLEPKVESPKNKPSFYNQNTAEQSAKMQPTQIEGVELSLIKKYLTTSTFFLVVTFAAGIVIFILVYFAGVITA